jgi:allophanate hydrolase subunit 1
VRSKIDLPDVCFKNVQSAFVYSYEASEIPKITNTTPLMRNFTISFNEVNKQNE